MTDIPSGHDRRAEVERLLAADNTVLGALRDDASAAGDRPNAADPGAQGKLLGLDAPVRQAAQVIIQDAVDPEIARLERERAERGGNTSRPGRRRLRP
jgi:hypothetical protein